MGLVQFHEGGPETVFFFFIYVEIMVTNQLKKTVVYHIYHGNGHHLVFSYKFADFQIVSNLPLFPPIVSSLLITLGMISLL